LCNRAVADHRQERVAVGGMGVGSVRNDTDHARHLTEHDPARTARVGLLEPAGDRCPRSDRVRQELQRCHVTRSEHAEVASIQCRKLGLPKSLSDGQHYRVDETNVGVGILVAQLACTPIVLRPQILHSIRTRVVSSSKATRMPGCSR
jgi:hypothetical protein